MLAQLREVMKKLEWTSNEEARAFRREAETLIEGPPPGPGKK